MKDQGGQLGVTRLVVTVAEAAELLAVSSRTVYRWIASDQLQTVRLGKKMIRIKYTDLERFVESCQDTARPRKHPPA